VALQRKGWSSRECKSLTMVVVFLMQRKFSRLSRIALHGCAKRLHTCSVRVCESDTVDSKDSYTDR
jgi:hypothetical protein